MEKDWIPKRYSGKSRESHRGREGDNRIPEKQKRNNKESCTSRGGNNRGSEGLNIWLGLRAFKSGFVEGTTVVTSVLWGIQLFALQWLIYNVPGHSSDDLTVPDQAVVSKPANPHINPQPRSTKTHIKPQEESDRWRKKEHSFLTLYTVAEEHHIERWTVKDKDYSWQDVSIKGLIAWNRAILRCDWLGFCKIY